MSARDGRHPAQRTTGPARAPGAAPSSRLEGTGEDVGRGLGRLLVALLEVVRQVLERQALRRVDAGGLTDDQVEHLGQALLDLEDTFDHLRDSFGVREEDLYLPVDVRRLLDDADAAPSRTPARAHRRPDLHPSHPHGRDTP